MSPRSFLVLGGQFAPRRRKDADFAVHLRINHRGVVGKTLPIVFLQLIIHRRAHLPVPGQEAQLTAFQRRLIAALEQQARVVAAKRVIHRRNDFLPRHIHDARQAILLCQHIVAAVITHTVIQRLAVLHRLAQHISLQIQEIACFRVIPDTAGHFIRRQRAFRDERELRRRVMIHALLVDFLIFAVGEGLAGEFRARPVRLQVKAAAFVQPNEQIRAVNLHARARRFLAVHFRHFLRAIVDVPAHDVVVSAAEHSAIVALFVRCFFQRHRDHPAIADIGEIRIRHGDQQRPCRVHQTRLVDAIFIGDFIVQPFLLRADIRVAFRQCRAVHRPQRIAPVLAGHVGIRGTSQRNGTRKRLRIHQFCFRRSQHRHG